MAHMELKKFSYEWAPANYKVNETTAIFGVGVGECIVGAGARVLTAFDDANCTVSLGDGSGVAGYLAVTDAQNTGFEVADGAYLINAMGKLYTAADTVDAKYIQGDTDGTAGKMRFYIIKAQLEP